MQDDVYPNALVGGMFVILGVNFDQKAKESSERDGCGGRPKVMLVFVEEPNAETEDWIWDTGTALDIAWQERFLRPSDFCVQVAS